MQASYHSEEDAKKGMLDAHIIDQFSKNKVASFVLITDPEKIALQNGPEGAFKLEQSELFSNYAL